MNRLIKRKYLSVRGTDENNHRKHTHINHAEWIWILSGHGTFLIGDRALEIRPGRLFVIDSETLHCSSPADNEPYVRDKIVFYKDALENLMMLCNMSFKEIADNCFDTGEDLHPLMQRLAQSTEPIRDTTAVCELLEIIGHSEPEAPSDPTMGVILETVAADPSKDYSVAYFSRQTHLSPYHLCRQFKQKTGFGLMEYVTVKRMDHAKKLLADEKLTVTEVSTACGYDNLSSFCRRFQAIVGVSPSAFRRQARQTSEKDRKRNLFG